jgi:transcriptional regulator with XRE-family HTH domain
MSRKKEPKEIIWSINVLKNLMRQERERLGISQDRVAKHMGISGAYLSQLENGQRHIYWSMWIKWCAALHFSPATAVDKWMRSGGFDEIDADRRADYHQTIDLLIEYGFNIELDNLMVYFKSLIENEQRAKRIAAQKKEFADIFRKREEADNPGI